MGTQGDAPGWRRRGPGERRWPGALAVVAIIGIQLVLPQRYTAGVRWVLPALEVVLIGVLVAADPGRMERRVPVLRRLGLVLIAVVSSGRPGRWGCSCCGSAPGTTPAVPPSCWPAAPGSGWPTC
ncbi:hypothetical protein [Actinoplanes sp. NPDC051494]|uniref:hypothetical protein n=1 Tax=Actinoplanes sp. NPDC051494 TaxID=3363907 RepID=UPI0037A303BF